MISKERPSTAGMTTGSASGKLFETFSKEHREKLAIGATTGAWSSTVKAKRSKARITVVIRKRPLTQAEAARNETDILKPAPSSKTTMKIEEPRKNVCGVPYIEMHTFTFDRAYSDKHTNKDIYRSCVRQLVDTVFTQGARCSCFTYGQTGSGKTYTMCGPERMGSQSQTLLENQGILEMAAHDCFKWLHQPEFDYHFGLYVSFFEIYCNKVYDLLGDRRVVKALETKTSDGVVVKDLTTVKVDGVDTLVQTMNSGLDLRVVGSNSKNTDSSRGHAVLTLEVRNEHTQTNFGKLAFIDLAGSERGADAMFSGKLTQTDGAGINRSLLALKECIRALDQQSSHVPFRDSELTKVLRDMFIGNKARTLMISCVAPSSGCCEQTLNTLRYTERVKAIRRNCQPDVETTDEEEAAQTGRESEVGDEGKGRSRRVRGTRSNEQTRKVDQTRDDNTETKSCGRKRVKDSSETRCESHKRPVQRSSSRSIDGSEYLTDSGSSLSSMLSLGTSHASDDRQRMMSSGSDEDGAPPLSARRNEDQLNIGICHMPRVINQTRDDDITASEDGDVLSPRARIASAALSLNRNAKLSRGSDARLTASCFDPNIGSPSPVATRLGTTDINHDSVLRSSLNRPRPLSGTLTSENRGLAPTLIGDRPSSQQLTVAATPRRSNLSFLPQRSFQLGNAKGRTSSLVREQPLGGSTKALAEMASRQVPLRDVQSQQPSTDHDETRTTIPLSFTTHRENGRSEIAKFFPQPESDDVLAAANILRKRYREFEFPVPPKSSPSDGKHVEALTAIEMLDELLIMPAKEIHTFYDQYTYKIQQFYADLVQAHMDCLKAHTCSGMTQQKMLKEIYSSHDQQFDISSQYLSNLRSTLENQLLIQFRLAKRLGEMERMLALQRTIGKGFQAASASEVEYYPFNPPVNSSQDSSNASSSVVHSSTEPASARLSSKIGGGIRNVSPLNQLTQSLNSGNHHTSNIHGSNRTAPGAGERTAASTAASTTATSTGTASLRSIREYSPMVTPYVERRESIAKPRTASTEASSGCNIDIVNSNIRITPGNNDSRPLQPPTALSLEGPVRIPTNATTVVRRRDLREPPIGSDGFPIPNDIGHRSTATMSTTYSARRARRSRKAPFTELGQEGATRTGELSSEGFEQAMAARSKRPTRQA